MATVHLAAAHRELTGGVGEVEVDAPTVRRLIRILDEKFPGLGQRLAEASSVAINGEIIADAEFEEIPEGAEVHFLDMLQGG